MFKGKSIIHVITSTRLDRGGPSLSATQLMEALRLGGQEGMLVCPDAQDDPKNYAVCSSKSYPSLEHLLAVEPRDSIGALHIHGVWEWYLHQVSILARKSRIPYVFSPHGMLEPWAMSHRRWKKRLAWWLYQRNDLKHSAMLLATAPSEAEQFSRLGLTNKTVVLPNGIDFPADLLDKESEQPSRDSAAIRTALFLSRIHPKKGLGMLVEAWAKVRPQGWQMRVVGPDAGGHRQWVESQVKRYDLQKSWTFQEAVYGEEKAKAFLSSDLFILPTFSENFGIAVAEALAHRLPVVTTKGAPWQGLIDHRCGWWVAPSVEGITQALAQATSTSSQELNAMGQRGRTWAREEFAWPTIAQRLKEAYELYIP